ncbi:MAG: hypothetical protein HOM11_15520, partial [Methylococcales bacterium]|nr:hypothetical protein [Methylococcales bacterium]
LKQQYQQSTPIQLPALTAAQAMAKIDLLPLKPEAKKQILSDYNGNKVRLVEITLWDNYAEDGDIVEFSIGSFALTVPILHKKKSFVVPLPIGVNTVNVKGIRDGGGGITAAVKTSSGALAFPLMRVGEVIQLPIL